MRIKELIIKNFRRFSELQIEFPRSNSVVFIGDNGAGKSTVLDCIAIFLSQFANKLCKKSDREQDFSISKNDINISSDHTLNTITVTGFDRGNGSKDEVLTWRIAKHRFNNKYKSDYQSLNDKIELWHHKLTNISDFSLPILCYYQIQRMLPEISYKTKKKRLEFNQLYAYDNAFQKGINNFNDFIEWFEQEENYENERKIRDNNLAYVNPQLEAIRKSIEVFFNGFPAENMKKLRIERGKGEEILDFHAARESSLVITKNGNDLILEQLSSGEKMILMLVSDLARRLVIANPGTENALAGKGIVLIDEIDLHLHPKWQREIMPCLTRTFPNIQFIVSTHSPQVISNVKVGSVLGLVNNEAIPYPTFGRDNNWILQVIMKDTERPVLIQNEIEDYFDLIIKGDVVEAQKLRRILEEKLGGDNDPIFVKADILTQ